MKGMRKLISAIVLGALLTGCDGGSAKPADSTSGGSVDAKGHVTLEFWYALGGDTGKAVEELVKRFNASQADVSVVATYQGDYTAAMAKIYSAITSNSTAAVVQVGGAPLLGSSGALAPISDFLKNDKDFDIKQIRPAFLEYNSVKGTLWSMPFNNSVPVMYYNQDLFKAAGLDPEKPPSNLEDLLMVAQKLTLDPTNSGTPSQWGVNTRDDTHWYLSTLFLENGAQIVNEEMTQMVYNSPQSVEMLQLWGDWVNKYHVMPPNQHSEAQSDFLAGKLGMYLGSSAMLNSLKTGATFKLGVAQFPAVGSTQQYPIGGGSLAIFKNKDGRITQAAWNFVKFMISKESAVYLATQTGYLPIYTDAFNWPEIQASIQAQPERAAAIQSLDHVVSIPVFPALGNSDLALRMAIQEAELGKSTAQQSLDKAKASVDRSLKDQFTNP
ncbi:MAG: ABC transporter substrate-binding protein [Anaerolineaceae bacterium]|nr:ABC transporter substrate-binding protein [Anaerolineaceae bacterium]